MSQRIKNDGRIRAALEATILGSCSKANRFVLTSDRLVYFDIARSGPSLHEIPVACITSSVCHYAFPSPRLTVRWTDGEITITDISSDDAAFIQMFLAGILAPDDWP